METRQLVRVGIFGLGSVVTTGACGTEAKECTLMDCIDGATISVKTADGTWAAGAYELTVTSDGVAHSCTNTLPDDLPTQPEAWIAWSCTPNLLSASLSPEMVCTEVRQGDDVSGRCGPVADRFVLTTFVTGTPQDLEIRLSRDQVELLNERRALSYVASRPNGPDCEPLCRRAQAELSVPGAP